jgi:hypothetical protein
VEFHFSLGRVLVCAALVCQGSIITGCGSGVDSPVVPAGSGTMGAESPAPAGTGTLIVSVTDIGGRRIAEAYVYVSGMPQVQTDVAGEVTIASVRSKVIVHVDHEAAAHYQSEVTVEQQGVTIHSVVLQPRR